MVTPSFSFWRAALKVKVLSLTKPSSTKECAPFSKEAQF